MNPGEDFKQLIAEYQAFSPTIGIAPNAWCCRCCFPHCACCYLDGRGRPACWQAITLTTHDRPCPECHRKEATDEVPDRGENP